MRRMLGSVLALVACESEPSAPADDRLLEHPPLQSCRGDLPPDPVVVVSWNMSAARRGPLEDVEATLAELDADVVLLQENDVGVSRTGNVHQPAVLAEGLGYDYAYAEALPWDGGTFGLAVLSRLPFHRVRRRSLFATDAYEPRIALDVELCRGSEVLRFVDVHADFEVPANAENLADLATQLGHPSGFVLVAGDFNAEPDADSIQSFGEDTGLIDVLAAVDPRPTRRNTRVDYAFVTAAVEASLVEGAVVDAEASDHDALRLVLSP